MGVDSSFRGGAAFLFAVGSRCGLGQKITALFVTATQRSGAPRRALQEAPGLVQGHALIYDSAEKAILARIVDRGVACDSH
jgi:hypothetical protein